MNPYPLSALLALVLHLSVGSTTVRGSEALKIPSRDPKAPPELIDLSTNYNSSLDESWHASRRPGNDLSELPHGLQKLDGIEFDLRGVIQVSGNGAGNARGPFPKMVHIKVGLRCQRLQFLHGTGFREDQGTQIGTYVVHYADGKRQEIPIVYGQDVRDWWAYPQESHQTPRASVAWKGSNGGTRDWGAGVTVQLFRLAWKNPRPDSIIESIDFIGQPVDALPFLLAITAEREAP